MRAYSARGKRKGGIEKMNNTNLEVHAKNTIAELQPLFDQVKAISSDLMTNSNIQDINRYYSHQDTLTGIYGNINIQYKKMRALKKNKEVEHYHNLKLEADVNNTKFVSAVAEKEASYHVASLREARDIIEGYVEILVASISTCRSHIYSYEKDRRNEV